MRGKPTFGQRRDAGTAGQKLKSNLETIKTNVDQLRYILRRIDASMPDVAGVFRSYLTEARLADYLRPGSVGWTVSVLGELSAALNIGLRMLRYETFTAFLTDYEKKP